MSNNKLKISNTLNPRQLLPTTKQFPDIVEFTAGSHPEHKFTRLLQSPTENLLVFFTCLNCIV